MVDCVLFVEMLFCLAVMMEMRKDYGCIVRGTLVLIGATNALILTGRSLVACQQRRWSHDVVHGEL